jgi:hypothetical protein
MLSLVAVERSSCETAFVNDFWLDQKLMGASDCR